MKNYLKFIVPLLFFFGTIYSHELRTPKGTIVSHTHQSDSGWSDGDSGYHTADWWTTFADQYWGGLYIERLDRANQAYNCHSYAWADSRQSDSNSWCWISTNEDVYWTDYSYLLDEISPFDGGYHPGTRVSYGTLEHSLLVYSGNIVTSKWGKYPCYRHYLYSDPYGAQPSNVSYYRYYIQYVPQDYSSINEIVADAVSGQTCIVSAGNYTLTGNITIGSGITLTLSPGVNINFNGYYIEPTGGIFNINNNPTVYLKNGSKYYGLFTSIQSAVNSSSSNKTIELLSPSFTENLTFSSKSYITLSGQGTGSTILNGSISVNNSNNIYIDNMCINGIVSVNSSQLVHVTNCLIPSATMLSDYYSTQTNLAGTSSGTEEQASYAVTSYGGTGDIYFNTIRHFDVGVFLGWGASYNVGDQNTFCNNGVDIYSPSPSYAYAISNDYSYALPNCVYGNVFVTGSNGICSLPKISPLQLSETNSVNSKILKDADEKYLALLRKITDDSKKEKYDKNKYANDYANLVEDYKNVINQEKELQTVKAALSKLNHLFKAAEDKKSFASYLTALSNSTATQQFVPYIKRYSIWDAVDNSDYNNSISIADEVLAAAGNDEDLTCEMIYEKGLIYKYYLSNSNKAEEMFAGLIAEHPQHLLAKYASIETGIELKQQIGLKKTVNEQITNYSLDNYPNPFNPTTTISYGLPRSGRVILKVYDVLGREIAELVNEVKDKGMYSVVFDASKLASGIYIYTLRVNDYYASKKMILTK